MKITLQIKRLINDEVNGTEISSIQPIGSDRRATKDLSNSHDTNIIGTISKSIYTSESDQSYLPLDSPTKHCQNTCQYSKSENSHHFEMC